MISTFDLQAWHSPNSHQEVGSAMLIIFTLDSMHFFLYYSNVLMNFLIKHLDFYFFLKIIFYKTFYTYIVIFCFY